MSMHVLLLVMIHFVSYIDISFIYLNVKMNVNSVWPDIYKDVEVGMTL